VPGNVLRRARQLPLRFVAVYFFADVIYLPSLTLSRCSIAFAGQAIQPSQMR